VEIVAVLCRVKKIREEDVAVLTPYSSQKAVILDKIEGKGLSGVTVQTVTESQGILFTINAHSNLPVILRAMIPDYAPHL